jgi:hypothetical protein
MANIKFLLSCFLLLFGCSIYSQIDEGLQFQNPDKKHYKIKFTNFNNLIIVEANLNGKPLNFLLDTGVDKTVLFGIEGDEEQIKKNSKKITIKGVSGKKQAYAYKNINNTLEIGNLKDTNHDVYVIFDKAFNISDKIGYKVQGVIGYNFFKNHIVKINYIKDHLKVYQPEEFNKSLKRYDSLTLSLFENKPYVKTVINQIDNFEEYIFLLDIGSGDSIWLKPQFEEELPKKSFYDILGYGFADIIFGHRSKAKAFKLGEEIIDQPKIAYPDSLSYTGIEYASKSGIIGSEVMRRFHWYFDYANRKVFFKSNGDIDDPFNYDMSGLVLKYNGYQPIAEYSNLFSGIKVRTGYTAGFNKIEKFKIEDLKIRPVLIVGAIRPDSPAYDAGFIEGDQILKINGRESHNLNLQKISKILSSEDGRIINFQIIRNGFIYNKSLTLRSRFLE